MRGLWKLNKIFQQFKKTLNIKIFKGFYDTFGLAQQPKVLKQVETKPEVHFIRKTLEMIYFIYIYSKNYKLVVGIKLQP